MARKSVDKIGRQYDILIVTNPGDTLFGIRALTGVLQKNEIPLSRNCFCSCGVTEELLSRVSDQSPQLVVVIPEHDTEAIQMLEAVFKKSNHVVAMVVELEGSRIKKPDVLSNCRNTLMVSEVPAVPSLVKRFMQGHNTIDKLKEFLLQGFSPGSTKQAVLPA